MKFLRTPIIITVAFALMLGITSCKANKMDSPEAKTDSANIQKPDTASANDTQPNQTDENQPIEDPNVNLDDQKAPSANAPTDMQVKILPAYQYPGNDPIHKAVADYLTHEIAKNFAPSDVSIPSISIVGTDTSNPDDTLVNYKLEIDTLLTESGGSHPGMMHLKKSGEGYAVIKMDIVADGSDNQKSAKEIFGDKYEDFHKINSNQNEREKVRLQFISDYVKSNKLSVTKVKDFGGEPVDLP